MRSTSLLRVRSLLAIAFAAAVAPAAQASCGSAFCSVNTDWASDVMGLEPGSVLDLRYEYIPQAQPRSGSRKVGVGEVPADHDEVHTINRNLLVNYSRNFGAGWGLSLQLPLVDRDHLHIRNDQGTPSPESWQFRDPGDLRLVGRYQRPWEGPSQGPASAGVLFGVKLPTGRTKVANAQGEQAERSLQPGTGTTDAIVGAYLHQQVVQQSGSWFAQAQLQGPLDMHDGFAPGAQLAADIGYAMDFSAKLSGVLQLNAVFKQHDRGANAEPDDSGGRSLYLSPGFGYAVSDQVRIYGFYQLPLYQYVRGVQLTADKALILGVVTRF